MKIVARLLVGVLVLLAALIGYHREAHGFQAPCLGGSALASSNSPSGSSGNNASNMRKNRNNDHEIQNRTHRW
jgi:hypothetical protein